MKESKVLAAANNKFAFDCYHFLKSGSDNLFFSPFSITLCLAMTYAGAKGHTAEEMGSVLHYNEVNDVNRSFNWIIGSLNAPSRSNNYQLSVANAVWLQEDYNVFQEYLTLIEQSYSSSIFSVDFRNNYEAERIKINTWVEEKTKNKIKDLIRPGLITQLTRLVLTNAIYFFSNWENQFSEHSTTTSPFTIVKSDGLTEQVKVPLMWQKKYYPYAENSLFQAIELPYRKGDLSMVILLPKKVDGIFEMEKSLTAEQLTGWLRTAPHEEVEVYLPKFKITTDVRLAEPLRNMGMIDAFDMIKADFSGITPKNPNPQLNLFISEVIHKAFIDVNERGTEAAAATAVVMLLGAAFAPTQPILFKVDHPFLLLIRDTNTDTILFLGRIMDPRSE